MKLERIGRTRVLVAGALAVPVVLGSVALAGAATIGDQSSQPSQPSQGATHGTAQLTDEGLAMVKKSGTTSGAVTASIGPDGKAKVTQGETGSAALTQEGKAMVAKSGVTSGSVTAGPDGVTR
jgi:glucose/arabinose dehydrogenase